MVLILLVEDDADIREDITEVLELENYEVIVADDGLEAIDLLKQHNVDIILSDVLMPNMTGYELLAHVRTMDAYQMTPFIFISAVAVNVIEQQIQGLTVSAILTKPFPITDLLALLQKINQKCI